MTLKTCPKCRTPKSLESFHKSTRSKDGRSGYCKPCAKTSAVESKRRHKAGRLDCGCPSCSRKILAESGLKHCGKCETVKLLADFYRNGDGYQTYCIACTLTPEVRRRRSLTRRFRTYGISEQDFANRLEIQDGRCICGDPLTEENLRVDHDHRCCPGTDSCGKCVRGFLCHTCNVAIGMINDSPNRALAIATYLLQFEDVLLQTPSQTGG